MSDSAVTLLEQSIVDVIVVGAGLSGLAAASQAFEEGLSVCVLEAQDHIGGRLQRALVSTCPKVTAKAAASASVLTGSSDEEVYADLARRLKASELEEAPDEQTDVHLDLGGQWIGASHHLVSALAKGLGLNEFPTPHGGLLDVLVFQKQKVIFDAPALPLSIGDIIALDPESFGISERLRDPVNRESIEDVLQVWSKIEKLAKEIDPRNPWEHPMAEAWDSTTLSTWLAQNAHTALGNWFVQTMNRMGGSGGYEPAQVSLLHALWTQRVSPQREAPETSLLDGGAGQLPELLAQKLPQGTIRLNSPVVKIEQHRPVALPIFRKNTSTSAPHPADAVATITLLGGDQLHARHAVIVACPPHVAGTIIYEPPMPPRREQLTQRAPMGTIIKVLAVFDSPFWLEEGLSGTAMGNLDTLEFVADSTNTLKPGAPGVLASFIVGKAALRHLDLSPRMRRVAIEDDLSKFFSPARIEEHLVDVIEAVWPANQFVGGAFTAFFGPGVWTAYEDALWRPVGRVVWAGTEVSTRWPGYMEGALQAGYDAADEVLEMVKGDRVELKGSVGKS